jgi:Mlc titration factor MtfA (ptsG expression regulator)
MQCKEIVITYKLVSYLAITQHEKKKKSQHKIERRFLKKKTLTHIHCVPLHDLEKCRVMQHFSLMFFFFLLCFVIPYLCFTHIKF